MWESCLLLRLKGLMQPWYVVVEAESIPYAHRQYTCVSAIPFILLLGRSSGGRRAIEVTGVIGVPNRGSSGGRRATEVTGVIGVPNRREETPTLNHGTRFHAPHHVSGVSSDGCTTRRLLTQRNPFPIHLPGHVTCCRAASLLGSAGAHQEGERLHRRKNGTPCGPQGRPLQGELGGSHRRDW